MVREWKFELTTPDGLLEHYIHSDGRWEFDAMQPLMQPEEITALVSRLAAARMQFARLGWTRAELRKLP